MCRCRHRFPGSGARQFVGTGRSGRTKSAAKRGRGVAASYKPSALANKDRIITGFAVDPSSENKVIGSMLDQSEHTNRVKATAGSFFKLIIAGYLYTPVFKGQPADVIFSCGECGVERYTSNSKQQHHSGFPNPVAR